MADDLTKTNDKLDCLPSYIGKDRRGKDRRGYARARNMPSLQ